MNANARQPVESHGNATPSRRTEWFAIATQAPTKPEASQSNATWVLFLRAGAQVRLTERAAPSYVLQKPAYRNPHAVATALIPDPCKLGGSVSPSSVPARGRFRPCEREGTAIRLGALSSTLERLPGLPSTRPQREGEGPGVRAVAPGEGAGGESGHASLTT